MLLNSFSLFYLEGNLIFTQTPIIFNGEKMPRTHTEDLPERSNFLTSTTLNYIIESLADIFTLTWTIP